MDTENHHYLRWLSRTLIIRVGGVIGLALMMWLLPSLTVDNLFTGFAYVAVVAILNALLWPILSRIFLPTWASRSGLERSS